MAKIQRIKGDRRRTQGHLVVILPPYYQPACRFEGLLHCKCGTVYLHGEVSSPNTIRCESNVATARTPSGTEKSSQTRGRLSAKADLLLYCENAGQGVHAQFAVR